MPQNRKETAWKKSRKFGDVKGGRLRPKLADNIFNRQHNFLKLPENEQRPVLMLDNPSRDFFFPVSTDELMSFLNQLPEGLINKLTHIWFRKVSNPHYSCHYLCTATRHLNV